MRLFIIRHADPDYPNKTITPAGHLEARALAKRMAILRPDRIYSSPLGRALHTAQYSADACGLTVHVEDWTAELSDYHVELEPWGKLCAWDTPGEVIRAAEPYPAHHDWHQCPTFADPMFRERFEKIRADSDAFIARHGYVRHAGRYRIERPSTKKVAVFCHGGFGLCWLAHLLEIPLPLMWSGFFLTASSVTTVLFDERSSEWAAPRCMGLADISHLHAEGLPAAVAGIKANCE